MSPKRISDLNSATDWVEHYQLKGKDFLRGIDPARSTTADFRRRAVSEHLYEQVGVSITEGRDALRCSAEYTVVVSGNIGASLVPGLKMVAKYFPKHGWSYTFLAHSMKAYGLGEKSQVLRIGLETCMAVGLLKLDPYERMKEELLEKAKDAVRESINEIWNDGLRDEVLGEIRDEIGEELLDEALAAFPIIGQFYGLNKGWTKTVKSLNKIIDAVGERAAKIHSAVYVPAAVEKLVPAQVVVDERNQAAISVALSLKPLEAKALAAENISRSSLQSDSIPPLRSLQPLHFNKGSVAQSSIKAQGCTTIRERSRKPIKSEGKGLNGEPKACSTGFLFRIASWLCKVISTLLFIASLICSGLLVMATVAEGLIFPAVLAYYGTLAAEG